MYVSAVRIRKYLEDCGYKQAVIAKKLGTSPTRISNILRCKQRLYANEYFTLCNILNVPYTRFLAEDKEEKNNEKGENINE